MTIKCLAYSDQDNLQSSIALWSTLATLGKDWLTEVDGMLRQDTKQEFLLAKANASFGRDFALQRD